MTQPPDGHEPDLTPQGGQGGQPPHGADPRRVPEPGGQPGPVQPGYEAARHGEPTPYPGGPAPSGPAPGPSGGAKRWLLPALVAVVALILGLGVGMGAGVASTSGERRDLEEQTRQLQAERTELEEQVKSTQAALTGANAGLAGCRASTAALQELADLAAQFLDASSQFNVEALESEEEFEGFLAEARKVDELNSQLLQQMGVAKVKAEACSAPGTKS